MCGIFALFGTKPPSEKTITECLKKLDPRGPEYKSLVNYGNAYLGFTRLAINGLTTNGNQPINHKNSSVICNGEIYNYKTLAQKWSINLPDGSSDCQVLATLFTNLSPSEACRALDGVFAIVVLDFEKQTITVARDPYGVRPLYVGQGDGFQAFASEIKALTPICNTIIPFPPGTWCTYTMPREGQPEIITTAEHYHEIPWIKNPTYDDIYATKYALLKAFEAAIEKRCMSDRPIGALLSGGLDSSSVCAFIARVLAKSGRKLDTFSIGMPGSTDLLYARKVAEHIKSNHHEITLSSDDFFSAIPNVIRDAETYDITSVRASVGNWLIGKYIKENTDIKVVFNGDGSDEALGGYLYFYRAPSDEEFESEINRRLKDIHMFDVLRSDRSMAAHGLEARTPFLDKQFVAVCRSIPTKFLRPTKQQPEKFILRFAFDGQNLLPEDVLWRKKEAFSDGVSATEKPWHLTINDWARAKINNVDMLLSEAPKLYPNNTPKTAESLYYRIMFEDFYGKKATEVIPYFWMPKWSPETTDPSARTLSLY
jgi:asparagine synthase (glutamine-hydrolysing)